MLPSKNGVFVLDKLWLTQKRTQSDLPSSQIQPIKVHYHKNRKRGSSFHILQHFSQRPQLWHASNGRIQTHKDAVSLWSTWDRTGQQKSANPAGYTSVRAAPEWSHRNKIKQIIFRQDISTSHTNSDTLAKELSNDLSSTASFSRKRTELRHH